MASNHLPLLLLPFEEISEYAVTGQTSLICIFRSQSSMLRFGQKTAMHYSFQKHVGKKIPFYPGHNWYPFWLWADIWPLTFNSDDISLWTLWWLLLRHAHYLLREMVRMLAYIFSLYKVCFRSFWCLWNDVACAGWKGLLNQRFNDKPGIRRYDISMK